MSHALEQAQNNANYYTKMKLPLEEVLFECTDANNWDTFLEELQYMYLSNNYTVLGLSHTQSEELDEIVWKFSHPRRSDQKWNNPPNAQGHLAEGCVVAYLNTCGFKCPECGSMECFAPIPNDLEGVYSTAWRDCVCVECHANHHLTLFEVKTRNATKIKNGINFKTNAGHFIALNTMMHECTCGLGDGEGDETVVQKQDYENQNNLVTATPTATQTDYGRPVPF